MLLVSRPLKYFSFNLKWARIFSQDILDIVHSVEILLSKLSSIDISASMEHDRRFNTFIQVHIMVSWRVAFCSFKPQCFWLRRVAIIRYSKKKTIQSLRKYPRLRTYSSSKSSNLLYYVNRRRNSYTVMRFFVMTFYTCN